MSWIFSKKDSSSSSSSPSHRSSAGSPNDSTSNADDSGTIDEMYSGSGMKWTVPNYDTGKNIDSILQNLFQHMNDSSQEVKAQIRQSLEEIGDKLPILTLCKGLQFLASTSRGSNKSHRVLVMNLMTHVLDSKAQLDIPRDVADALVKMSVSEIVAEKTISSEWQNSANFLLIAATRHNPAISARLLLENFKQGKIPHYFIIKALADFAHRYPKEFLPHLKDVLSRTLPLLGTLKHDNMKWVFSAALGRWSQAVVRVSDEYPEEEVDPREYSASMRAVLQHALQEWLLYKQSKVRLACAQGIGYMCYIIEPEELLKVLPKLIPDMIKLLKKEKNDQLPVSIGIRHMTRAIMRDCPQQMEEHFENFLTTIHGFIVSSNKNKKYEKWEENLEELCYTIHYMCNSSQFTDRVVTFVQKQIASTTASVKVASLKLLNHLILHCDTALEPYKDQLVSALLLANNKSDTSMSMLSAYVDCVRSMAEYNYLKAQGGTELVQVVIQGSSITDAEIEESKKKGKEKRITPETVRTQCDEILTEMTSGSYAAQMDDILWPFLIESLTPPQYAAAFVILCKCISDIAKRKKNDSNFIIDFDREANLPKPDQLFARLIVMLSQPYERNDSGVNILRTLYCLSPNLNASLVEPWSKQLPLMKKKFLDVQASHNEEEEGESESQFDQDQWENAILSLVKVSIESVDDDQWNVSVGDALLKQAETLYTNRPQLKRVLLTIVGLIIQRTNYKEFVIRAISGVFNNTNHKSESERLGCARGLGQASMEHTDTVLTKLARIMQTKEQKRSFFSKSSDSPVSAEAKATALLCYAYLCRLTPPELLKPRVDVHVIANIVPVLRSQKLSFLLKKSGLQCLMFIGASVTPDRIPDFKLKARDELINVVLEIMTSVPVKGKGAEEIMDHNYDLTLRGLETLTTLIKLPPRMTQEVQQNTVKQILKLLDSNANGSDSPVSSQEEIMEELHNVLAAILRADLSQSNLDGILTQLEVYTQSSSARARRNSSATYVFVLKEFAAGINENKPEADSLFNAGKMIGLLTPRLTEPVMDVRRHALDSIYLTLRIQHFLSSPTDSDLPESIQKLMSIRSRLDATEPEEKLQVTKDVVSVYASIIDDAHLQDTLKTLLTTFSDVEEDAANGACFVYNGLIRYRGKELEKQVDQYVKMMVEAMNRLSSRAQIVKGLLLSIRGLAKHYPLSVIGSLLSYPVPHSKEVINSFRELAKDKELLSIFFDHVIDLLNNSQLYDEKTTKAGSSLVSVPEIDSATSALHETLSSSDCYALMDTYYHQLVVTIVLRVGSANGVSLNPPVVDAQLCMRNLLKCARDEDIVQKLDQDSSSLDKLMGPDYPEGIQNILELICKHHPDKIRPMFDMIKDYVKRQYLGQKVAATAAVSVLLNNIENDREMVNDAINCLLNRSGLDEPVIVKLYAIRGLAKLYKHPKEILHRFLTSIMTSLIAAVEDKDEGIILETMTAIRQLFSVADDEYASDHLLNLCIRLKPSFEKANPELRSSSIHLFGSLARYSKGKQSDALINKFHENLPTILLHLRDPEDDVIVSCKNALTQILPAFGKKESSRVVSEIDVTRIRSAETYEAFVKEFSSAWVEEFPERIFEMTSNTAAFFDSQWPTIVAGACLLLGYMIAIMNDEQKQRINLRHNCGAIMKLLKNQHVQIRDAAAKVLGMLDEA